MSGSNYLSDVCAVVLEQGLGKARSQILQKQLESKGGKVEATVTAQVTHIVVGNNVRLVRVPQLLKVKSLPESILVVRADWLSACLVKGEKVDHAVYVVKPEKPKPPTSVAVPQSQSPKASPLKDSNNSSYSEATTSGATTEPGPSLSKDTSPQKVWL